MLQPGANCGGRLCWLGYSVGADAPFSKNQICRDRAHKWDSQQQGIRGDSVILLHIRAIFTKKLNNMAANQNRPKTSFVFGRFLTKRGLNLSLYAPHGAGPPLKMY